MATVFPYISSGPGWYIIDLHAKFCRNSWWHNLLYINNLVSHNFEDPFGSLCFGEAWYLAIDMQFFILSPIIIFILWKWATFGNLLLGLLNIGSILTPGILTGVNNLPPGSLPLRE